MEDGAPVIVIPESQFSPMPDEAAATMEFGVGDDVSGAPIVNRLQWLMARLALSNRPVHATYALQVPWRWASARCG